MSMSETEIKFCCYNISRKGVQFENNSTFAHFKILFEKYVIKDIS